MSTIEPSFGTDPVFNVTEVYSRETAYLIGNVVMYMLGTFSVFGSIGNALVLIVFSRTKEALTSTLFILTLAVTDLLTCAIVIPYTMIMLHLNFKIQYDILCKLYQFAITSNVPFSALLMAAIAVDRYLCICHPFLQIMNTRKAKIIIFLLALVALSLGVLPALSSGTYQMVIVESGSSDIYHNHLSNENIMLNQSTTVQSSSTQEEYVITYNGSCTTNTLLVSPGVRDMYKTGYASVYLISLLVVVILYGLIYRYILKHRAHSLKQRTSQRIAEPNRDDTEEIDKPMIKRGTHGKSQVDENHSDDKRVLALKEKLRIANIKTAIMLSVVAAVFLVAFLPAWLMVIRVIALNPIIFYIYFSYNVVNPIIYAFMNQTFRADLRYILSCTRAAQNNNTTV